MRLLAQAASSPQQIATRYQVGLMLIVMLGLLGLGLVLLLMRSWRKHQQRLDELEDQIAHRRAERDGPMGDAWTTSAARLGAAAAGASAANGITELSEDQADALLRDADDADDPQDEPQDPFNLFGGQDPLAQSPGKPTYPDEDEEEDNDPFGLDDVGDVDEHEEDGDDDKR
jgi:hypothetical protein